jgi:molybdate transport system regulatory protein
VPSDRPRDATVRKRNSVQHQDGGRFVPPRPPRLGFKAKFWLTLGPQTLFGDGKADLLAAIDRLGSLRSAAQSMGMSYRYAWGLLRELEEAGGFAFLEHSGSGPRSNLRLTAKGRCFLEGYRQFRAPLGDLVEESFRRVFGRSGAPTRRSL